MCDKRLRYSMSEFEKKPTDLSPPSQTEERQKSKKSKDFALRICLCGVVAAILFVSLYFVWSEYCEPARADASSSATSEQSTMPTETVEEETSSAFLETEQTTAEPLDPEKPSRYVALTFDDGPSVSITPRILDVLEKYRITATFFVLGSRLSEGKMTEFRRAIAMGCEIGNHSATHVNLTELSEEALLKEIQDTNAKITDLSCNGYRSYLLRPPGGHINQNVMDVLYRNGVQMHAILWDCDSRDWEFCAAWKNGELSKEEALEGAYQAVMSEVQNGSVILMHDIQEITPELLERVIEGLIAQGYGFLTVSELLSSQMVNEGLDTNQYHSQNKVLPLSEK